MGNIKGLGLRREKPVFLRLTKTEKARLLRKATAVGLSMAEFARCQIFGYRVDETSGKLKIKESHNEGVEATKATP